MNTTGQIILLLSLVVLSVAWTAWAFLLLGVMALMKLDSGRALSGQGDWAMALVTFAGVPFVLAASWVWALRRIPRAWAGAGTITGILLVCLFAFAEVMAAVAVS